MRFLKQKFLQIDGPTWVVAAVLYGAWLLMIWYNALLPWWIIMPVGAYLVAWHFSLQHEAIHSFRGVPAWLRFAVVYAPLGLWFPYPLYRKSHTTHHRDINLTIPGVDTESYYVLQADWARMGAFKRRLLIVNQTMAGRLLLGPLLRLWSLISKETRRVGQGDTSHLPHWIAHAAALGLLFWFVSGVCGLPWWQYCLLIAYPGLSLGLLRAFTEHRAAEDSQERTASVESNALFGVLFLYNNLHVAHHLKPTMPWYEIPRFYRENRTELLANNGQLRLPRLRSTGAPLFADSRVQPRSSHPVEHRVARQNPRDRRDLDRQYARVVRLHRLRVCSRATSPAISSPVTIPTRVCCRRFLVFGLGFVVRPLGAVLIGNFGDRAGRKAALTLTIIVDGRGHRHHCLLADLRIHRRSALPCFCCWAACCRGFRRAAKSAAQPPISWKAPTRRSAAASPRGSRPAWGWPIYWAPWRRSRSPPR